MYNNIAKDFYLLINNKKLKENIKKNIYKLEENKLYTWNERMEKEVSTIEKLIMIK